MTTPTLTPVVLKSAPGLPGTQVVERKSDRVIIGRITPGKAKFKSQWSDCWCAVSADGHYIGRFWSKGAAVYAVEIGNMGTEGAPC